MTGVEVLEAMNLNGKKADYHFLLAGQAVAALQTAQGHAVAVQGLVASVTGVMSPFL